MNPGSVLGSQTFGSSFPFNKLGHFKLDREKMVRVANSQNGVSNVNKNIIESPEIIDTNLSFISLHVNSLLQSSMLIVILIIVIVMCRCLTMVRLKKLLRCASTTCTWSGSGCCSNSESSDSSNSVPVQYIGSNTHTQLLAQQQQFSSMVDLSQPPLNPAFLPKARGSLQEQLDSIQQILELRERLRAGEKSDTAHDETAEDIRSKLGTWSGIKGSQE